MKFNKWTVGLAAVGVVSLASAARADEKMSALQTALSNTTLSGYVDTAAQWNPGTDQNSHNGGAPNLPQYAFAKDDGFSLNAIDLALDHPEDESPWAAGYHVELMAGPNAPLNSTYTSGDGNYASIRQAYVTLRTPVGNGIDWKVGVWDTIIGYESTSDPLNPNYTRSYGYSIEPTTATGVLATYKINDMLTIQAGIADMWGTTGSPAPLSITGLNGTSPVESQKAYMGDIQFTAPDSAGFMKGATFTLGAIDAAGLGGTGSGAGAATSLYAGATIPTPMSALKVGAAFDYLDNHNSHAAGNTQNDSTWVVGLYGNLQATDKLSFNLRGEYLSSDGSGLYDNGANPGNAAEELTATAQYNLWANVISRVEFRWDHVEHGDFFGANAATGDPNRANDFLLALNLIYQF
ncbi:MAG TPA: outer membrane beta-barrel protein [Candidatus Sulfopaludibacter sp.]|nr:outer membrane beta-barrel protein [Candidatus Sulfopaludibacter sp.]